MIDPNEINRLGFDAWANNKIVDAVENTAFCMQGEGFVSYESKDVNIRIDWTPHGYTAALRAYTHDGWKETGAAFKR